MQIMVTPLSLINTIMLKILEVSVLLCKVKGGWCKLNSISICQVNVWCNIRLLCSDLEFKSQQNLKF